MILYDVMQRFTDTRFQADGEYNLFFFVEAIDTRLNLWNYLFYLSCAIGLYKLYVNRENLTTYLRSSNNRLLLFSLSISIGVTLILTASHNKHNWYLAPYFPMLIIISTVGIEYIAKRKSWFLSLVLLLLIFCLSRHSHYLQNTNTTDKIFFANLNKEAKSSSKIVSTFYPEQHIYLNLKFLNTKVEIGIVNELKPNERILLLMRKGEIIPLAFKQYESTFLKANDAFCIYKLKNKP